MLPYIRIYVCMYIHVYVYICIGGARVNPYAGICVYTYIYIYINLLIWSSDVGCRFPAGSPDAIGCRVPVTVRRRMPIAGSPAPSQVRFWLAKIFKNWLGHLHSLFKLP